MAIQLKEIGAEGLPTKKDQALNERDYGDLTGLNKDDARAKFGEEQVHIWRRSYDVPPPGGESLELTAKRVLPYYEKEIKPELLKGKKIIIAAHGNSLRALVKDLEGLTPEETLKLELATGVPLGKSMELWKGNSLECPRLTTSNHCLSIPSTVYEIDDQGKVLSKKILE